VQVTLAPIHPDELPVLRNLWELYVHDFTEFLPLEPQAGGRFETDASFAVRVAPPLELLWIKRDGLTAGFVFIRPASHLDGDPTVSDLAQFFVLRGHRRTGVGRAAALLALARRPGRWEVREAAANTPAQRFWRRVVAEVTAGRYVERAWDKGGVGGVVQVFEFRGP
jgi:predicted acetyltransferase